MLIVFDLDGTLIDSAQDLAISMNATLAHLNRPPLDPKIINSFVGNGAAVLVPSFGAGCERGVESTSAHVLSEVLSGACVGAYAAL